MEGSWTFAGCVISDSKSSTPSHALFYTKHDGIAGSGCMQLGDFIAPADLSPDQHRANHRAIPPLIWTPSVALMDCWPARESLCYLEEGYVMAIHDCKQRAAYVPLIRGHCCSAVRRNSGQIARISSAA